MKKLKVSFILNIIIFVLVVIATIMMFCGIRFTTNDIALEATKLSMFKYYTVDSNIFAGLGSLTLLIYQYLLMKKKIKKIPNAVYIFKHMGVIGVSLTFITTLLFLGPTIPTGFFSLYTNSNFFFHLVIPIVCFVSFCFFDKFEQKKSYTLYSLIPTFIYSIFYFGNIIMHITDGLVDIKYDFYGFLNGKFINVIYVLPIMFAITYLISLGLLKLNNKMLK